MIPQNSQLPFQEGQESEQDRLGVEVAFDFAVGEFVLVDGKCVEVDGMDAIKLWVEKCLRTERDVFEIYEGEAYGIPLGELLVGYQFQRYRDFFVEEIKREVTEALTRHPMIMGLSNWEFRQVKAMLVVEFDVLLRDGNQFRQGAEFV
ncbi:DUF2634 domain-containing protein [Brevibacillus dissolubilis]|uniref:DUF2634 domain-containing protein n=1 Tax=Brevibacillus dissolubilis TaxID=1844116 RepID=UPI001116CABE|nr:DUF2634 domain-containing protein [Brevibacillus dissolubilis]